jgi:hypothetical protein
MSHVEVLAPGVTAWTNKLGIRCYFHHHTGHPGRRKRWAERESKRYPGGRRGDKWRREQDGDPSARPGEALWKGFIYERNVITNDSIRILPLRDAAGRKTGWYHVLGLDWGGTVANAGVFWGNRPSPTWQRPDGLVVPILPHGQWIAYAEVYKPDCPTRELKLRLYREAIYYLGLRNWAPFNNYVTDVFGDPQGKQFRIDFEDPGDGLIIKVSIGHTELDQRLNARTKGIELVNSIFTPQKVCCGIHYYGRNIECERCHLVMPSIPGGLVMERCTHLIHEYQIATKKRARTPVEEVKDGKMEKNVPQHAADGSRYALVGGDLVVRQLRQAEREEGENQKPELNVTIGQLLQQHLEESLAVPEGLEDLTMAAGDPYR